MALAREMVSYCCDTNLGRIELLRRATGRCQLCGGRKSKGVDKTKLKEWQSRDRRSEKVE